MNPIETQNPLVVPSLKKQKHELEEHLRETTVDYLRSAYKALFGKPSAGKTKNELIAETAEALAFSSAAEFRTWFFSLPGLTQKLLYRGAFTDYMPVPRFDEPTNTAVLVADRDYSWRTAWMFNPALGLAFLPLYMHYGCPVTLLPRYLRAVVALWLAPPPTAELSACKTAEPEGARWDNSATAPELFPLLCDTVQSLIDRIDEAEWEKILRSGFRKRERAEIRSATGLTHFPLSSDYAPDSADLGARFLLCMYNYRPDLTADGLEAIRGIVTQFFSDDVRYPERLCPPDKQYLEYMICIDHLTRSPGSYLENSDTLPASRECFYAVLTAAAQDGGWFDADRVAEYIRIRGLDFSFCEKHLEKSLKLKADTFTAEGQTFIAENAELHPEGILRHHLLTVPLFKAYGYIFAALGVLEIAQTQPVLARTYRNKHYPASPYSSLKAFRVTDLGRWCLGVAETPPPRPSKDCHAIADRELFLVTVQGNSLERRVYLDRVGQRLGEERWRINPATFIAGCTNQKQIAERIHRFKTLIDPNPAAHWEGLFEKVSSRAGLFNASRSDMIVYDLPQDAAIAEELLRDPAIKQISYRAEGKMLVIPAKDQPAFFALLSEHGIAHF